MNSYPSWIHRIPEMLEVLALLPDERIDRRRTEELFDLRRSAAHELLRRFGAERNGNSLSMARSRLMARLREAQEGVVATSNRYAVNGIPVDIPSSRIFRDLGDQWSSAAVNDAL